MMNRREVLKGIGALTGVSLLPYSQQAAAKPGAAADFIYCLNMATIRGHKLGFIKELEVASKGGFRAIEIWMDSLKTYLDTGGTLADAKKRLDDLGLRVESAIGFSQWIIDDESLRMQGIEQMKKEMEMLARIGCKRTAAPPAGATDKPGLDLKAAADRYRRILELGDKTGVVPQLEMWGFSKNLARVSEVMYVALESGHPSAKILLDIFHLYKGGSPIETLHLISNTSLDILHMNDYAWNKPATTITDSDRIYPGDGIAPIRRILQVLKNPARPLLLSVEVFNKTYYSLDPLQVVKTALTKMKAVTANV
jgi:sugar phosphate isomerase/epimerase